MYLVRRVWKVKPRATRQVAALLAEMGKQYEDAGQRSPTRVYWSGGTVPGPANTVYMDWTEEALQSPYRAGNEIPGMGDLGAQLRELTEDNYVEFYEMYVAA